MEAVNEDNIYEDEEENGNDMKMDDVLEKVIDVESFVFYRSYSIFFVYSGFKNEQKKKTIRC